MCFISVIIPVFNDCFGIEKTLESLSRQSYPRDLYEIIVVDNNSTDETLAIAMSKDGVVCLQENKIQSSYAARNMGVNFAKGSIIAFTDAGCIVDEDWLRNGAIFLSSPQVHLLAGNIEFSFLSDIPNVFEFIDSEMYFKQEDYAKNGYAATANLFVRRNVFTACGLFNDKLFSGGDYEFCKRATEKGFKIVYGEDVVVFHPARYSFNEIFSKARRVGLGLRDLRLSKKLNFNLSCLFPKVLFRDSMAFNRFGLLKRMKIIFYFNFIKYYSIFLQLR